MQKSYEYHSVTLSVKMRHAGDQFAKKTWQFFRVWSWFWYKILPEIIWKKGWSIFFKLAFEYQELRTHTTTQTYFKKNLWHWAPHESWNPPGQLKKNQKRPTLGLEESQHGYGESASTLSAGCGFRSCAGFVEENSAPFEGRTSWTICVFLVPKSLAFLAFLGGAAPCGGFFKTKKNNRFKCWLSNLEFDGGPKWCELKYRKNMIPKKITQPNCLTLIRDQCFQILDSSFCWSSCFEALLVQGTIETIYCITFLWIIRFILHIWPHHEANLRFVLVAGHWKYLVFLTVLLCACTFKGM